MALVIDRLGPRDLEGALRLSTQAGWNQLAADWERLFDLSPEGCLAGRLDGHLVATATVASFGHDVHWVGMVLVDEALRGRGFGSQMLTHVIDFARARGGIVGLDATDLGRPVYLKLGFVDVEPIDRWSGTLRATGPSDGVDLIDRSTFDEVALMDREALGADRSALLLHLMHEPGVLGVVARGEGYAFLRPGRTCSHVGPMVAKSSEVQSALLNRFARLSGTPTVLLDALWTSATAAMLPTHGLTIARHLTRMTLGKARRVLASESVRAAVSFEWG
ncbi:MAG TPA: GNAT family N-acetyltransferase [Planctomycetota bacterium]|nr:GNAT family N-acetyltransferase [Planctomycetota bacterium]